MERLIYQKLLDWKNEKETLPLMVIGVRQCGKTHIINEFIEKEFKRAVRINLLQDSTLVKLYGSNKTSLQKYKELKAIYKIDLENEDIILFIDEIQESEELISELKYFAENYPRAKIICAGSLLGVKLKRMKSSYPVGKVKTLYMYPMSFEEYLMALGKEDFIDLIKEAFDSNCPLSDGMHEMCLNMYKEYLILGGMPESIKQFVMSGCDYNKIDRSILFNIQNDYINDFKKYVTSEAEVLKITKIFNSIPSQLGNEANKFQYSKIEKGARKSNFELPIDWLIAASNIIKVTKVTSGKKPLKGYEEPDYFKLYMSDIGIINNMLELTVRDYLLDDVSLYKGIVVENYVLNELVKNGIKPYYWESKSDAEVDFIINYKEMIVPIEVKWGKRNKSKSLQLFMKKYESNMAIRLSTKNFGWNEDSKIKAVPLYAVFCIKD